MSGYAPAREAFGVLANALRTDTEFSHDVSESIRLVLTRYNTQIYENRFLVGGVVERIMAAAFQALDREAKISGVEATRTDLCIKGVNVSVKGSFRPNTRDIRLVNVLGESAEATWSEATVIVSSNHGIGYADPELLPGATRRTADALLLPFRALDELWAREPNLLVKMKLPYSREDKAGSDVASRSVADEILRYTKRLKPFDPRKPHD